MQPLGLIAGEGIFPLLVARGARAAGRRVVCVALKGSAWPDLENECDDFHWVGVPRLGSWIRRLRSAGVSEAIMVGRVTKTRMYRRFAFLQYIRYLRTARLFILRIRRDKRTKAILNAITDQLTYEEIS